MIRVLLVVVVVAASGRREPAVLATGTQNSRLTPAARHVALNGHNFTLPDGFTIELVAGPKLAERPVVAAFDTKGRLYVCDSSGSNEPTKVQAEKKPHRIMRLVDADGDGVFDTSTVYVKNVMFPEGAMWLNGSLYVAAPPHIMKYTDTNDDGVADKEEIWFDGKTLTGCANDLHGPYHGPDGWIYWTKGAFAKQEYTLPGGKKWTTRAAHIFRARPDGTGIEPVMSGGMDNPVDVVFTPGGERIFSTTFLQHPRDGKRDGLIHAIYGGVYGKDHDPVNEHPWTGPQLMPPMTHLGPAAPAGLHRYESDQFGKEYANIIFACQFNMRKVSRHVLVPSGSTFTTKDSDFVVSDNIDFHPTDVIEDADGSLLIIDTGGWFKLCCPTSQLVKADVTGGMYRVRKVGAHKIADPRGRKLDWVKVRDRELVNRLSDPRLDVAKQAAAALIARGDAGIRRLAAVPFTAEVRPEAWHHAVAALAGVDHPAARKAARTCLRVVGGDLTMIAIHAAALWRDKDALDALILLLSTGDDAMRRAAAEALGRIGDAKAIPAILKRLAADNDRALDHSLTYALVEIGDVAKTAEGLKHASPRVRRACLAALENIPNANLDAKAVIAELSATDAALRETAWWVAGRHPQWGEHLAGHFRDAIKAGGEKDEALTERLVKFAKNDAVQVMMGEVLVATEGDAARTVLRAMARSGLKTLPEAWAAGIRDALASGNLAVVRDAVAVLRAVQATEAQFVVFTPRSRLLWPVEVVFQYLAARPPSKISPIDRVTFESYRSNLGKDAPPAARTALVDVYERHHWTADGLLALATTLKSVNALELPRVVGVFAKSTDEKVGLALVNALSEPAVRALVRAESIRPILDKYPKPVRDEAEKLYALLAEATKGEREKLDKLLASLEAGDVRRGQAVFNGTKGQCVACHKIGYVGGLVGPDLTRVGGIRTERDLLEAIVFPSASFVRSYEPVRVVTADGRTLNGVLKKDAPDEVVVAVAADKEERIARADIESVNPSSVSVMPTGLDQQLTPRELADLVAFLRACK